MIHDVCRQEWDTTTGAGKNETTTGAGKHHRGSLNLVSIDVDHWQEHENILRLTLSHYNRKE